MCCSDSAFADQHLVRQAPRLAEQAEQHVFGADEVVLVRSGGLLRQHDAVPVQVGEPLEGGAVVWRCWAACLDTPMASPISLHDAPACLALPT